MSHAQNHQEDMDIVAIWLRKDPKRWVAGILAGAFAGVLALAFACVLAKIGGMEILFPIKVAAVPILGNEATAYGMTPAVLIGFVIHELLCMFLGFVYAHFTGTNELPTLLGAGFTWGVFSWIFIFNLFVQSFADIQALHLSKGAGFFVMLVFGLSLTSTAFFDRMIRGSSH
jgi:hypothetical protein